LKKYYGLYMIKNKSNICAIIPARKGSKGVPDKNIKIINGRPLLAYSIKAALESSLVDRVIVSTDSQSYKKIAEDYGAEVPFIRPTEFAQDESIDIEFFQHAINWLSQNENHIPDYFVHLRPTTPLRDPAVIDAAIVALIDSDYTSLRSVNKMSKTAHKAFEISDNVLISLFSKDSNIDSSGLARQNYPITYEGNGYVDIVRTDLILNSGILHGNKSLAFVTDITYEIDEINDIELIEYSIIKNSDTIEKLFNSK